MDNFFMPTHVLFGFDAILKNKTLFHNLGSKAFIVTGRHSAVKCGALEDVLNAISEVNTEYVVFNEVTENPTLSTVEKGSDIFKKEKCDFIIAIGGGSPIDAAKAIAILAANNISASDIFNPSLYDKAIPLVAVPTTSGTGTEATHYSVITNDKTNTKAGFGSPLIFPKYSFCDPKYTITLNPLVTRDTGIDALSHLLEGVYSVRRNSLLMPLIYRGVDYIVENLDTAVMDPTNLEARALLMQASLWGGIVIAHTSTTLQHSIGYPVTTEFGISHGLANGIFLKPIMDLYHYYIENEIEEIFDNLGFSRQDFYLWLNRQSLSSPRLKITEEFIREKAPEVLASRNMALNPCPITLADIEKLYRGVMR
ncbi:MAG: iron-containing alcohol dehydrogenase [Candidatus Cloacimonetes bacterium]|nr:iron-containing alcohol dehydrogenase [Candidatus Cloacimonadota bacterium]